MLTFYHIKLYMSTLFRKFFDNSWKLLLFKYLLFCWYSFSLFLKVFRIINLILYFFKNIFASLSNVLHFQKLWIAISIFLFYAKIILTIQQSSVKYWYFVLPCCYIYHVPDTLQYSKCCSISLYFPKVVLYCQFLSHISQQQ